MVIHGPIVHRNVEPALTRCSHPFPGGHSGVVPPDPIPNSEVKRACADGSVALPCKSRSPPGALHPTPTHTVGVFFIGTPTYVVDDCRKPVIVIANLGGWQGGDQLSHPRKSAPS